MPQLTSRQGVACDADPKGRGGFAAAAGLTRLRGSSGSCLNRPRAKASFATPTQKGRGGFAAAAGLTRLRGSALDGARDLIVDLKERGFTVVLASSSPEKEIDHYLDLLDARELADNWTTNDDVEATKPEPDLVRAALDKAGADEAVMVGDTPWDIEAARQLGIATATVITGGFSEQELHEAGAAAVFDSLLELRRHLDEPPFV